MLIPLGFVGRSRDHLQIGCDVQSAHLGVSQRNDVVDFMGYTSFIRESCGLNVERSHGRACRPDRSGSQLGEFSVSDVCHDTPFVLESPVTIGVTSVFDAIVSPFHAVFSAVLSVPLSPLAKRSRVGPLPLCASFLRAFSASVTKAVCRGSSGRESVTCQRVIADVAPLQPSGTQPGPLGSLGCEAGLSDFGSARLTEVVDAECAAGLSSAGYFVSFKEGAAVLGNSAALAGFARWFLGAGLLVGLTVSLSVGRAFSRVASAVSLIRGAHASAFLFVRHFFARSMWASMMRLTSSAIEIPRRAASFFRYSLCGSVNEIICLVMLLAKRTATARAVVQAWIAGLSKAVALAMPSKPTQQLGRFHHLAMIPQGIQLRAANG